MFATFVLWYLPCGDMGLSKHGDPVFPHFCPLKQHMARLRTRWQGGGGGGGRLRACVCDPASLCLGALGGACLCPVPLCRCSGWLMAKSLP